MAMSSACLPELAVKEHSCCNNTELLSLVEAPRSRISTRGDGLVEVGFLGAKSVELPHYGIIGCYRRAALQLGCAQYRCSG